MKKIVMPSKCDVYANRKEMAFAKIVYEDGRLSISGVIGPRKNGNCAGSAGQCSDSIREGTPTNLWNREMLDKFCDIWDRWHLNDMNPHCKHQRELGWPELASQKITLYHYRLTKEAQRLKKDTEEAALSALRAGKTFTPTNQQSFAAGLSYFLDTYDPLPEEVANIYEPKKALYAGDVGATETKTRGWVRYDECEQGILCKPCPVCGYKYGTAWQREEVPQDVLDWLFALPDAERMPAWV